MSTHADMLLQAHLDSPDGELVNIDDPRVVRGDACHCFCPVCGAPLRARKGNTREHHFAHQPGYDWVSAHMTAIHRFAQGLIQKTKKIVFPIYKGEFWGIDNRPILDQGIVSFTHVDLELVHSDGEQKRIADCVGYTKTKLPFWIEIFVTHRVDKAKIQWLKDNNIDCFEIDLSKYLHYNGDLNNSELINDILYSKNNRKWLSSPTNDKLDKELLKRLHTYTTPNN